MVKEFNFIGYQNYEEHRLEIKRLVNEATKDEDMRYYLAINEAVCNAAKYSIDGMFNAAIKVRIRVESHCIATCVSSKTINFDADNYHKKLLALLENNHVRNLDWGDYTHDDVSGRGFWYMMAACDYILVDQKGQSVILHTSLPAEHYDRNHIGQLVSRFHVKNGGVII